MDSSSDRHARQRRCRTFRYIYYAIGGIYLRSELSNKAKIIFSVSYLGCVFLSLTSMIGFFLTAEHVDLQATISASWLPVSFLYIITVVHSVTYKYQSDMEMLYEFIVMHLRRRRTRETCKNDDRMKRIDTLMEILFWSISIFVVVFLAALGIFIHVLFFCDEKYSFRDVNHHLMGVPFLSRLTNLESVILVYFVEFIYLCCSFVG